MKRHWTLVVVLVLAALLSACDPFAKPDSLMEEYVKRLARVLNLDTQLSDIEASPRLPRMRDRRLEIEAVDLGMLDFLAFYGCDLQHVIGERTAILGRVMQPLNLLQYELQFLAAAQDCLPEITNEQRRARLLAVMQHKQENLPKVIWNATWTVPEIENLLSPSRGRYPVDAGMAGVGLLVDQLQDIHRRFELLLAGEHPQDLAPVAAAYQQWQYRSDGGQLLNSARLLTTRLDDASELLKQRLTDAPLCYQGTPNQRARQMHGMFLSVYIGEVQPYISSVHRAAEQLFSALAQLAEQQAAIMPDSMHDYYQQTLLRSEQNLWGELDNAVQQHTELWQQLLDQCGMRPGH